MRRLLSAAAAVAVLGVIWAVPIAAHHSFGAEFDANQPIKLRGKLSKMEWVNPHGWIHVDVAQPSGSVVTWAIEAGGPNALIRRGLRKVDFPIGAEVIIDGFRAKNGTNTANGRTVTFADGRNFFLGATDDPQGPPR